MDNNLAQIFSTMTATGTIFKILAILLSLFYLLYAIIISKQVQVMDKTLRDKLNQFIFFICSLQVTVALILLIFSIFLI